MFFDPKDELNKDLRDALITLSQEQLYGDDGEMANAIGKWITYHMLYASDMGSDEGSSVAGYEVQHIESIEDFLNSGTGSSNWKQIEAISLETQRDWIASVLKKIINNEQEIDSELKRYVGSIADQDKLLNHLDSEIESYNTTRKDWLESFIDQSVVPVIMKYQDVASSLDSHEREKKQEQQKLMNQAEEANNRVKQALEKHGELQSRYDIDSVDLILDMLEEIVNQPDISENDVANFVLMNAPRFDEDVRYLLTTRFPVSQEE